MKWLAIASVSMIILSATVANGATKENKTELGKLRQMVQNSRNPEELRLLKKELGQELDKLQAVVDQIYIIKLWELKDCKLNGGE